MHSFLRISHAPGLWRRRCCAASRWPHSVSLPMHRRPFFLAPVLALLSVSGLPRAAQAEPPPGYVQTWSDEFDGPQLDAAKWSMRSPGKRGDALNTPDAI